MDCVEQHLFSCVLKPLCFFYNCSFGCLYWSALPGKLRLFLSLTSGPLQLKAEEMPNLLKLDNLVLFAIWQTEAYTVNSESIKSSVAKFLCMSRLRVYEQQHLAQCFALWWTSCSEHEYCQPEGRVLLNVCLSPWIEWPPRASLVSVLNTEDAI